MSKPIPNHSRTTEEAHAWFIRHGVCITDWCRERGFDRDTVFDLLRKKRVGRRGEAHRAAVALGLKADPDSSELSPPRKAA